MTGPAPVSKSTHRPLALLFFLTALAFKTAGCGAASPEAQTAEAEAGDSDEVVTGRLCAGAVSACGIGRCTVDIDNRCETPVTCQLHIESLCQTTNGQQGPASATSERVTLLSGAREQLGAAVSCGDGSPITTLVEAVACD